MTYSRFERGDAASFEVVIVLLLHDRFGQRNYSEDFQKLLKDPGSICTWTRRVISRATVFGACKYNFTKGPC